MKWFLALFVVAVSLAVPSVARADEDTTTRVMTFNVRYATAADGENIWDNRKQVLLDTIGDFGPDLLGTQEVLEVQVDYLRMMLPGYTLVGVGRDDGQRRGEFSPVMFRSDRFEALESGTFWLSETPDRPGSKSWDSALPRIATWVKLRDRDGGPPLCFLNTHWDHVGNQARVESAKLIRRWLTEHAANMPTIVTGDLNVTEDHAGYRALLPSSGEPRLVDVYRQLHPQPSDDEATFHGFTGKRRGKRIDFILASPQWTALEATIDHHQWEDRYPSDHYPVTAVLKIATDK